MFDGQETAFGRQSHGHAESRTSGASVRFPPASAMIDLLRSLGTVGRTDGGGGMTYSDNLSDNGRLLLSTVRGVSEFSGRSRRTEVIYYWIACALLGAVIGITVSAIESFQTALWLGMGMRLLFAIPMFALFVRRLHDQSRSGWWGMLLPLAYLSNTPRSLAAAGGDIQAMNAPMMTPLTLLAFFLWLVILVLCFWPGTTGPNQFGPDPRLEGD
jgi:uncharacterized membrane protein YhaH (DUF805 family)